MCKICVNILLEAQDLLNGVAILTDRNVYNLPAGG